jgi:hypothetical protein
MMAAYVSVSLLTSLHPAGVSDPIASMDRLALPGPGFGDGVGWDAEDGERGDEIAVGMDGTPGFLTRSGGRG